MLQEEIAASQRVLKNGGLLLYPTDTVWGLGCDATDEFAVAAIFDLKKRVESKSLIVLVDSFEMLQEYVEKVPDAVKEIFLKIGKPTTIIYNNPKKFAKNTIASDNTIAIRIVKEGFSHKLIQNYGKPIISTSANISGSPTPKSYSDIDLKIVNGVDYVVDVARNKVTTKSSTILRVGNDGVIEVLRE